MSLNGVQSLQRQVESPHVESTFKQDGQTWLKVYICDTDYINKNGWGLSDQEVIDNLNKTGIDAPGLLTDYIYHPRGLHNIATAGLTNEQIIQRLKEQQEKEAKVIYRHKSFYRDKENQNRIYSNVLVTDPKAVEAIDEGKIPQFVSAAAYLFDQPTGKGISRRFHFIHTAIVRKPAFPFAHAIIKAKCTGPEGVCTENLAVAGVQTQNEEETNEECGCPFVQKVSSLVYSGQNNNITLEKIKEEETSTPVTQQVKEEVPTTNKEVETNKQPVKVITKEITQQPQQEQPQQQQQPAPVNTEEFFNFQRSENEMLKKRIAELELREKQRDLEKRREIIASYVNKVYEHDPKKANEEVTKYLGERYSALNDEVLIEVLKDRFGEQVIEVSAKPNKRLVKAGLEDFVTNDAQLKGSDGNTTATKKLNPLVNFSSVIDAVRNNGGI